jgi:outer membrane protein
VLAVSALALLTVAASPKAAAEAVTGKSQGDVLVRLRALAVVPQEEGDVITAAGAQTGLAVEVDSDFVPEIDFSYFITDNLALELIAATTRHEVTTSPTWNNVGKVRLLPPTLTLQYHFLPKERVSPYVGAGINYTIFFDTDPGAFASIDYDNSFGFALQAGVDIFVGERLFLNLDVKKLFLDTDVSINGGALRVVDADLDPWLIGIGVGYRF